MANKPAFKHSRTAKDITCESGAIDIRIFINGILHFVLYKKDFVSLQSWYISEHDCKIEIYTTTRDILLEYNSVDKWKTVLSFINDNI